ncbi:hypothetical protein DC3_41950 [Deinococcus cellulosilyticus NBRC 106333 = KACC 11606]|uniref:Uncharacterized protein n=1 Tax=Deinococcus cellulosilyticus (strain DSM 18568 / NBRC 106333 / KACC 11606 / 5516J-15) TaxID=1223518 RepID=A0A511N6W0_DEIC1|nr:hypothetical protein DC3_41950 [Deinococcus cellulosilyticus NBRC 106333 = KACC 11606]
MAGKWVTCHQIGIYDFALTKGKKYQVLKVKEDLREIRLRGDNQRHRWYPTWYFDLSGGDVPILKKITVDDPIDDPFCDYVEVTLTLSDGNRRWCVCATPSYFQRYIEDGIQAKEVGEGENRRVALQLLGAPKFAPGGKTFLHFNIPHLVMFSELSEATIWTAMKHMDDQGELEASSVPYSHARMENDLENE